MNEYERRQEEKRQRLIDRAEAAERESDRRYNAARQRMDGIPAGQPILVGHHSERRHRRDLEGIDANMRASVEASKKADELRRRARRVGKGGISGDDPDAIDKLKAKLFGMEQDHERMKKANRIIKKHGGGKRAEVPEASVAACIADLAEIGFDEAESRRLLAPDFMGRVGFPSYALTNNNANIRRVKKRIEELEARADEETEAYEIEAEGGTVEVVDNVDANRVRIYFPDKPRAEVRDRLKSNGFRWSRRVGAWQRHRSTHALDLAKAIANAYGED